MARVLVPLQTAQALHTLSAQVVRPAQTDPNNTIERVWFTANNQEVYRIPQGQAFQIHVACRIQKTYVASRTPDYIDILPGWEMCVAALCTAAHIGVYGAKLTYPNPLQGEFIEPDFILDRVYTDEGWGPAVMGNTSQTFTIYLLGNLDELASVPTPNELMGA